MARLRSDKSKTKPLDKPVDKNETVKEGSTNAEPTGRGMSEMPPRRHSSQPAADPQRRPEQQRQEPSAEVHESEKSPEPASFTANGHQRIAERAFMLFQESGCEHGNDWFHWFEAERADRRHS
jgi:hypothetical protein